MTRAISAVLALLIVAVGVSSLLEPSTLALLQAVRELGPISGWRCASSATYVYDPHREPPDATLLEEPPEVALLAAQASPLGPKLELDRVEVNLRGGDTVISTRMLGDNQNDERRVVYVLSPGRLQAVGGDLNRAQTAICYSQLGGWRIIGEHALQ